MSVIEIILNTWWLSLLLFILIVILIENLKTLIVLWARHKTIRKQGYPPEHCNSDGVIFYNEVEK